MDYMILNPIHFNFHNVPKCIKCFTMDGDADRLVRAWATRVHRKDHRKYGNTYTYIIPDPPSTYNCKPNK